MRGVDLFISSWGMFSILELALNAVLSFGIQEITADMSDAVERMFIVLLVRIVTFARNDLCKRHIKNIHSKGTKRKAEKGEYYFYWFHSFKDFITN